jgi:FAD/FMN-containing dehydrogenase
MSLVPDTNLVREFRHRLTGRVIAPDDDGYDEARTIFYGGYDRRPALIARVADAADVSTVVRLAREGGLELAVRSGGHSVAGHSASDGIVLDLSGMRAIDVDVENRVAWAETGFTAAEFTNATAPHGLGVGLGDTGSVGIGDHARRRDRLPRPQARAHDRRPARRRDRHGGRRPSLPR